MGMIKRNAKKYKDLFTFDETKPGVSPVAEMIKGNNPNLLPTPQPAREKILLPLGAAYHCQDW
jgi:hypothetical protein